MHAFVCAPVVLTRLSPRACASPTTPSKPRVLVAGGTGNVGSRLVRLLCDSGCSVTATSRDSKSIDTTGLDSVIPATLDLTKASEEEIKQLIGSSTAVVSAVGAPFSFGKVDGAGIAKLFRVAYSCPSVRVGVVVSSIGVGRPFAFPAAALNLFGGVLLFKDVSEKAVVKAAKKEGKKYFIVRPGGMESPTDEFGLTHNVKLMPKGSLAGGLVSNLQVAELIRDCLLNEEVLGETGKTVEVVAETDAPKVPLVDLIREAKED